MRFASFAGAGLLLFGAGLSSPAIATPPAPPSAADFEAAIARLEQPDPQAPQALNARLQYADFLADAATGDCHARLDAAQTQLDLVAARPAATILLPLGPARLASTAYKLHSARADCDAARRDAELHQALDAARDAVGRYRERLDYQSAAIMQFNVAATLHALNDNQAAVAALQGVIAMDRQFGYRDDARDNLRLLQHWQGEDESDAKIAALMQDFPAPRTAQFQFAWHPGDGAMDIAADETALTAGQVVHSTGHIALQRHVRADGENWAVSYGGDAKASLDLGHWPAASEEVLQRLTAYFSPSRSCRPRLSRSITPAISRI